MAAADVRIGSAAESGTTGTPNNVLITDGTEPFQPVIGTAAVSLGGLTVAATGAPVNIVSGTAAVSLGGLTTAATGTPTVLGTAAVSLGGVTAAASGTRNRHGTGTVTLGGLTVHAEPVTVNLGTGTVAFGGLTAAANGTVSGYRIVDQYADTIPAVYRSMTHVSPGARRLAIHRGHTAKGTNIFIVNGATVTTIQPYDLSTVTRTMYGGHDIPPDLTPAEITLLLASGDIVAV